MHPGYRTSIFRKIVRTVFEFLWYYFNLYLLFYQWHGNTAELSLFNKDKLIMKMQKYAKYFTLSRN